MVSSENALTFAGLYTFRPCMLKAHVTRISAFFEPRTTSSAATDFAGFPVGPTLGANETGGRRDGLSCACHCFRGNRCCCYMNIVKCCERGQPQYHAHSANNELTCAGLSAFEPCILKVRVTRISTFSEPRTTSSAATDFAGFPVGATLGTNETG